MSERRIGIGSLIGNASAFAKDAAKSFVPKKSEMTGGNLDLFHLGTDLDALSHEVFGLASQTTEVDPIIHTNTTGFVSPILRYDSTRLHFPDSPVPHIALGTHFDIAGHQLDVRVVRELFRALQDRRWGVYDPFMIGNNLLLPHSLGSPELTVVSVADGKLTFHVHELDRDLTLPHIETTQQASNTLRSVLRDRGHYALTKTDHKGVVSRAIDSPLHNVFGLKKPRIRPIMMHRHQTR